MYMLAYAGVCWRMLAYAGVCRREASESERERERDMNNSSGHTYQDTHIRTHISGHTYCIERESERGMSNSSGHIYRHHEAYMLPYADVCCRMLTYRHHEAYISMRRTSEKFCRVCVCVCVCVRESI
jgi:hypothetical protein